MEVAQASGLGEHDATLTADPKFEPSTTNCTVPVGIVPPDAGAIFAENVTACPKTGAAVDHVTVVVVFVALTVSVPGAAAVLVLKLGLLAAGLYVALIE